MEFGSEGGALAAIMLFFTTYALILGVISLVMVIAQWKVFNKAGKPGWAVLVPIYSQICLLEMTNYSIGLIALLLIPGLGLAIFHIMTSVKLAKAFNKSSGFAVVLILFPMIGLPILGFGKDEYHMPEK